MGKGAVCFDETRWPIVVVTLTGRLDDEDWAYLRAEAEILFRRSESYVVVTDMRKFEMPASSSQRNSLAEWAARMEREYGRQNVASIKVISSRVMRAALSAYNWLRGRRPEDLVVATLEEAIEAAEGFCRQRGLRSASGAS